MRTFFLPKQELFLKQNRKSITLFNANAVLIEPAVLLSPFKNSRAQFPQQAQLIHH